MHAVPRRLLCPTKSLVCFVLLICVFCPSSASGQEEEDDLFGIAKLNPVAEAAPANAIANKPAENQSVGHRYVKRHLDVQRHLIRRTCNLSDAEIKSLDAIGDDIINEGLGKPKNQKPGWLGGLFQPANAARVQGADWDVNAIKKTVKKMDEQLLSALEKENREIFQREMDESRSFRCEAEALFIIALLDHRLTLTLEQENRLKAPIAKWFETADLSLVYYQQAQGPIPEIADNVVADVLTKEQRESYRQLQKHNYDRLTYELQIMQNLDNQVDVMVVE